MILDIGGPEQIEEEEEEDEKEEEKLQVTVRNVPKI